MNNTSSKDQVFWSLTIRNRKNKGFFTYGRYINKSLYLHILGIATVLCTLSFYRRTIFLINYLNSTKHLHRIHQQPITDNIFLGIHK